MDREIQIAAETFLDYLQGMSDRERRSRTLEEHLEVLENRTNLNRAGQDVIDAAVALANKSEADPGYVGEFVEFGQDVAKDGWGDFVEWVTNLG